MIYILINVYLWGLIFYSFFSYFNFFSNPSIFRIQNFLSKLYEPILQLIRNKIKTNIIINSKSYDISSIILIILIIIIKELIY